MSLLKKSIKSVIGFLTLVALMAPFIHPLVDHDHHTEQHEHDCSTELAADACHMRSVHHDYSAYCEHEGHVSSKHDHCELCDVVLTKIGFYLDFETDQETDFDETAVFNVLDFALTSESLGGKYNKGPPAFS